MRFTGKKRGGLTDAQLARKIARAIEDYERRAQRFEWSRPALAARYRVAVRELQLLEHLPRHMRHQRWRELRAKHANEGLHGHD